MKKNIKNIGIIALIVLIVGFGYLYFRKSSNLNTSGMASPIADFLNINQTATTSEASGTDVKNKPATTVTSSGVNTKGFNSYGNAEYNFSIKYPNYVQMRNGFSTFHEIGNNWRLFASQTNQGKPVVSFSVHSVDQGSFSTGHQSYPLYFTAEVRVGVSPNVKECYAVDPGMTNQKITNVTINGVAFKKFSTSDAGMMKYTQVESYRTIHNKMCYVLEQIKSGSSYRDEKMATGTAESTLNNYFSTGETIIKTFKFTK